MGWARGRRTGARAPAGGGWVGGGAGRGGALAQAQPLPAAVHNKRPETKACASLQYRFCGQHCWWQLVKQIIIAHFYIIVTHYNNIITSIFTCCSSLLRKNRTIITYYYCCCYIIITYFYICYYIIFTCYYCNNEPIITVIMGSLLPIMSLGNLQMCRHAIYSHLQN